MQTNSSYRKALAAIMVASLGMFGTISATESQTEEPLTATSTESKSTSSSSFSVKDDVKKYLPTIHGVIRGRWEGAFAHDGQPFEQRFQVRNARVSAEGKILPQISYFIQIDCSDRGTMKFLDAYGQFDISKHWKFRGGQFRVPYGVDCFRKPGNYFFANRAFLVKDMFNNRAVGARIGYYGTKVPVTVEAGMFNASGIANHTPWQRGMLYAAKALYTIDNVKISASFASSSPDSVRMNFAGGCIGYYNDRWTIEGEYMRNWYAHHLHKSSDGWNIFADYSMPVKAGIFRCLSFQGRYDGMTARSNGVRNKQGNLVTNYPTRQRITLGTSIAYLQKPLKVLIRLNYEKYFYKDSEFVPTNDYSDKIVAEMVLTF